MLFASRFKYNVKDKNIWKTIFLKPLEENKTSILARLDYGMVEVLLSKKPNILLTKAVTIYTNYYFKQYKTGF